VTHPIEPFVKGSAAYDLKPCTPSDLSLEELKRCMAIIGEGEAVNLNTMRRDLPRSHVLAVARFRGEIVAVGAIKPVRKEYATGIAVKSKYPFPAETQELGYVSVDPAHRGHGLSYEIAELLISRHEGQLFATTGSPQMKKTLARAGYRQEGQEWEGAKGRLSLWVRAGST
jgi:RimJ/RimL family protein N-acetyltransferase